MKKTLPSYAPKLTQQHPADISILLLFWQRTFAPGNQLHSYQTSMHTPSAPKEKNRLHPKNRHRERYDFKALVQACPELAPFVQLNLHNDESIDFANPAAVRMLNTALLKQHYGISSWEIPDGYLCPPIPGRADYIHYMAELLSHHNYGKVPMGKTVRCLDIGVGSNCIYPIIGNYEYGWSFIGSDTDPVALENANKILAANPGLKGAVECRLQTNPEDIFYGVIQKTEFIDLVVCNPPFHNSAEEAQAASQHKQNNLQKSVVENPVRNFGGVNTELWCKGGEEQFVRSMVRQSRQFVDNCYWFSSLVAKKSHLKPIYDELRKARAFDVKTIPMGQGNKSSRLVAWTFLDKEAQKTWRNARWNAVEQKEPPAPAPKFVKRVADKNDV